MVNTHTKKKIVVVFGTRPEAIKMAPLCHALQKNNVKHATLVCVTGQHRDMLDQVISSFNLEVDVDLNIMEPSQDLFDVTCNVMLKLRSFFEKEKPDLVIVHGDTTTTLATALTAFYLRLNLAHVEAGLRTYDLSQPFPEEFNRQTVSKISKLNFAPTQISKNNLLNEGVDEKNIKITGNTVIDSLHWMLEKISKNSKEKDRLRQKFHKEFLFQCDEKKYILVTGHRRENFGSAFRNICDAIKEIALLNPDVHIIYPVHLNPNVRDPVNEILVGISNVHLVEPYYYPEFVFLLQHCYLVLTDSGGIQEEAPSLGKPVLVMRETTERPEAVTAGTVKLVGSSKERIVEIVKKLLNSPVEYEKMSKSHNPYGDGKACIKIVAAIDEFLKKI